jgi:hypothetical protein
VFLKRHVRRKDGKEHVYYSLCESIRLSPSFSTRRQNALFFRLNRPRSRFHKGRGAPKWL